MISLSNSANKTLATLIRHLQHFRQGVQTLRIHLPSITSTKKVENFQLPLFTLACSHAPCWLTSIIFACVYKCCQLFLRHHPQENQHGYQHRVYQAIVQMVRQIVQMARQIVQMARRIVQMSRQVTGQTVYTI